MNEYILSLIGQLDHSDMIDGCAPLPQCMKAGRAEAVAGLRANHALHMQFNKPYLP